MGGEDLDTMGINNSFEDALQKKSREMEKKLERDMKLQNFCF